MGTDETFNEITNVLVSDEANDLLRKHIDKAAQWRQERIANGEPADLRDLIKRFHEEPNKRGPILAAYGAAIWRLMEQEGML